MRSNLLLTALLIAGSSSAMAATDFTGSTVKASLLYPNTATTYAGPVSATVGSGVEFGPGAFAPAAGSIDVGASSLTFFTNQSATYGTGSFNGYRVDFAKAIKSATLAAGSTFVPNSVTFSGNSVFFNVSGETALRGHSATINISAVPKPAAWSLMIAGFAMIGATMRSRKRMASVAA